MPRRDTRTRLLDVAEGLAQSHGWNGFSFHDLARAVGVKTASIHYHFPTKADLGRELMARYRRGFGERLARIDARARGARAKVRALVGLFRETLATGDRLCLCGMLASDYATLPAEVRPEVRGFFADSERWLARVIDEGRRAGAFRPAGSAARAAAAFFSALEGAMIAARAFGDGRRLAAAGDWLLGAIAGPNGTGKGTSGRTGSWPSTRRSSKRSSGSSSATSAPRSTRRR
jgi:TetR/AcrR family transcriptional repressor of nem operon